MKKTIAVGNNIPNDIKDTLNKKGFVLVDDNYEGYVDAILYNSENSDLSYLNVFDNVIDMDSGALIVDIKNKQAEEIENILTNRKYTGLF